MRRGTFIRNVRPDEPLPYPAERFQRSELGRQVTVTGLVLSHQGNVRALIVKGADNVRPTCIRIYKNLINNLIEKLGTKQDNWIDATLTLVEREANGPEKWKYLHWEVKPSG